MACVYVDCNQIGNTECTGGGKVRRWEISAGKSLAGEKFATFGFPNRGLSGNVCPARTLRAGDLWRGYGASICFGSGASSSGGGMRGPTGLPGNDVWLLSKWTKLRKDNSLSLSLSLSLLLHAKEAD